VSAALFSCQSRGLTPAVAVAIGALSGLEPDAGGPAALSDYTVVRAPSQARTHSGCAAPPE
jgi:hypothetical protein